MQPFGNANSPRARSIPAFLTYAGIDGKGKPPNGLVPDPRRRRHRADSVGGRAASRVWIRPRFRAKASLVTPPPPSAPVRVAALYRFAAIPDCEAVRDQLDALCRPDVRGTLLVAHENPHLH